MILYLSLYDKKQRAKRALTKSIKTTNKRITNLIMSMWHPNDQERIKIRINHYKEECAMISYGVKRWRQFSLGLKPQKITPEEKSLHKKYIELIWSIHDKGDLKKFMENEYPSKKKYYARHQKFYIYIYNGDLENAIKYHNYINEMNLDQMEKISSGKMGVGIVEKGNQTEMKDYGKKEEGYIQMCDILKEQFKDREDFIKFTKEHIEDAKKTQNDPALRLFGLQDYVPQRSSPDDEIEVEEWEYEGTTYLLDENGNVYDKETADKIGEKDGEDLVYIMELPDVWPDLF